jgi:hypothetical protein
MRALTGETEFHLMWQRPRHPRRDRCYHRAADPLAHYRQSGGFTVTAVTPFDLGNTCGRGRYRTADRWCVKLPCSVSTVSASAGDVDLSWWRVPAVSPRPPFHGSLLRVMAHSWHTRGLDSQRDPKTRLSRTRRRSVRKVMSQRPGVRGGRRVSYGLVRGGRRFGPSHVDRLDLGGFAAALA